MLTVVGTLAFDTLARVKRLAAPEETAGVLEVQDAPGGTAGNVATALARLGAPPRLLAGVGPDFEGSDYERALLAAGVDLGALVRTSTPTSRAYIFFTDAHDQMTYFYSGASRELASSAAALSGRVHFAAGEISAYPALMARAERVSFDPGQEIFHRPLAEVVACLEHVDILFVNRHERERLAREVGMDVADILALGVEAVVESRGADGTRVHDASGACDVAAVPVSALDPTGGGDAHRAGFLFASDRGAGLEVAARFANVLGSFAVEHVGAQAGLPSFAEAAARYEKAYGEPFPHSS